MKRLLLTALMTIAISAITGCGSSSTKTKVESGIQNVDLLEDAIKTAMNEAGITSDYDIISHEFGFGKLGINTKCKTTEEEFDIYSIDMSYGSGKEWKVSSIRDAESKKYYMSNSEHDDVYDYTTGELVQEGAPIEIPAESGIESSIRNHVNKSYKDTDIDSITVNNDSIALVHLVWNVKNTADTTKKTLKMYSDDLAATMAQEHKELTEIAVFWKIPYLSSDCKWHYECKDGKAFMDDSFVNF